MESKTRGVSAGFIYSRVKLRRIRNRSGRKRWLQGNRQVRRWLLEAAEYALAGCQPCQWERGPDEADCHALASINEGILEAGRQAQCRLQLQ